MSEAALREPLAPPRLPRLGFLGVGWIGRARLDALAALGAAQIAAVADASAPLVEDACAHYPAAAGCASLGELLERDLDGIVIATPNALHAEQAITALEAGLPVFCQKPLARNGAETRAVVAAARAADRLLGVDFSYRHVRPLQQVRELAASGALGRVYALDLVFHNAYGPDKPWFRDRSLSGGGCLVDLGIHLVDLALWLTGAGVERATASLFAGGRPARGDDVEDFAAAQLVLADDTVVRLACSWNLHAGEDAVLEVALHGDAAGARVDNVRGSFYVFRGARFDGTTRTELDWDAGEWGPQALRAWTERLTVDCRYDPAVESVCDVAAAIDLLYAEGLR